MTTLQQLNLTGTSISDDFIITSIYKLKTPGWGLVSLQTLKLGQTLVTAGSKSLFAGTKYKGHQIVDTIFMLINSNRPKTCPCSGSWDIRAQVM